GWTRGADLKRNFLSLFLIQLTVALLGVVVTLALALAFGTRLERRRKYAFKGGSDWAKGTEDWWSMMLRVSPAACSLLLFVAFVLLTYKMMMPKYSRKIFLVSHLFCFVSMMILTGYAVAIFNDVLKFPHGSIGVLDAILDKEVVALN
ncbi:hypothetical protein PMAYCL1PPCAC_04536, partial [Pristionchus mayeri]